MEFLIMMAISIAISVIAYLLMPKPKTPKPGPAQSMDHPTADAGRPVPVIFGDITVKDLNALHSCDREQVSYEVDV